MQNFLHEEKIHFFFKIKYLYTINKVCVVIEIIASYFHYGLKMMSRNTLSAPQPESASYRYLKYSSPLFWRGVLQIWSTPLQFEVFLSSLKYSSPVWSTPLEFEVLLSTI